MLARALVGEPDILIVDEPVNGLDPAHAMAMMRLLTNLAARGTLVIASLHDLTLAGQFADRLILLHEGRLAADGEPAAVLRDDLLSEIFGAGVGVLRTAAGELAVVSHRRPPAAS